MRVIGVEPNPSNALRLSKIIYLNLYLDYVSRHVVFAHSITYVKHDIHLSKQAELVGLD